MSGAVSVEKGTSGSLAQPVRTMHSAATMRPLREEVLLRVMCSGTAFDAPGATAPRTRSSSRFDGAAVQRLGRAGIHGVELGERGELAGGERHRRLQDEPANAFAARRRRERAGERVVALV